VWVAVEDNEVFQDLIRVAEVAVRSTPVLRHASMSCLHVDLVSADD
jgi:hypothetical protein